MNQSNDAKKSVTQSKINHTNTHILDVLDGETNMIKNF